jgi:hypothetical protein
MKNLIDAKLIIRTFENIEEKDGVPWGDNLYETFEKTAKELNVTNDEVKDVLISFLRNQGAG